MLQRKIISSVVKITLIGLACLFLLALKIGLNTVPIWDFGPTHIPNGFGRFGHGDDGTLTNTFGFNDRDYPLGKTPGVFRSVVVGDSFSWASGLDGNREMD